MWSSSEPLSWAQAAPSHPGKGVCCCQSGGKLSRGGGGGRWRSSPSGGRWRTEERMRNSRDGGGGGGVTPPTPRNYQNLVSLANFGRFGCIFLRFCIKSKEIKQILCLFFMFLRQQHPPLNPPPILCEAVESNYLLTVITKT